MLYDCFTFLNELDLLEIRLNILNKVVDKFVIVEATRTHSNQLKPLVFADNKERFRRFLDKIIYVVVDKYPLIESAWTIENHQRNCIAKALAACHDDDVILISDLDEIPHPEKIKECLHAPGIKLFEQFMFYYFLNYLNVTDPVWRHWNERRHWRNWWPGWCRCSRCGGRH